MFLIYRISIDFSYDVSAFYQISFKTNVLYNNTSPRENRHIEHVHIEPVIKLQARKTDTFYRMFEMFVYLFYFCLREPLVFDNCVYATNA